MPPDSTVPIGWVAVGDPAAILPEILRHLPVKVHRVEVHEPSLEDVFLKLTGRGLEGENKP